jgi:hypothetical protein
MLQVDILAEIDAPDTPKRKGFNCAIVLRNDVVIQTAPIVKYMKGWHRDRVRTFCANAGWKVTVIHQTVSSKWPRETAPRETKR